MAAPSTKGTDEIINHYGLVRLRVKGSGNLQMTLYSLDEVFQTPFQAIALNSATNIEPTKLCNFTQQRAKLEIRTININETFQCSRVVIFVKPVAKSYPM